MARFREIVSWTAKGEHPLLEKSSEKTTAHQILTRAGADFDVIYPPARWWDSSGELSVDEYPVPMDGDSLNDSPLYKWVVRADTGDVLGLHSGNYPTLPNYGYLADVAEELFPNSAVSCTVFGKGERIALSQQLQDPVDLGGGDLIQPSLLWITSFNAQWATAVHDNIGRLFCMNQLVGNKPIFKVRHTKNHNVMLEVRSQIVMDHMKRAEAFTNMARILKDQDFTNEQFNIMVKNLVPDPIPHKDEKGVPLPITEMQWFPVKDKRKVFKDRWVKEVEQFGSNDVGGNRWLAYNAIQGAEQHDLGRGETSDERSFLRAIEGKTTFSDKALSLLRA